MAALLSSSASSVVTTAPTPHSTAPVLEFLCLFTHDLKRKQKRWHDGRLKYHTFNKRVMVYDDRGYHVGDMHWRLDYDLEDGEEIQLERGVLVQVAECVGRQEQDLSDLVDKRIQEREQRQRAGAPREQSRPTVTRPAALQPQHRPLHQVLGTPSGHHGRASVPTESPYVERQRKDWLGGQASSPAPATKRPRYEPPPSKSAYATSLFGAPLTLSCQPSSTQLLETRASIVDKVQIEAAVESMERLQHRASISKHRIASPPLSTGSDYQHIASGNRSAKLRTALPSLGQVRQLPAVAESVTEAIDLDEQQTVSKTHRKRQRAKSSAMKPSSPDAINSLSPPDDEGMALTTAKPSNKRAKLALIEKTALHAPESQKHRAAEHTTLDRRKSPVAGVYVSNTEHMHVSFGKEKRAELRVKPRKKRGLLMLNEPHAQPTTPLRSSKDAENRRRGEIDISDSLKVGSPKLDQPPDCQRRESPDENNSESGGHPSRSLTPEVRKQGMRNHGNEWNSYESDENPASGQQRQRARECKTQHDELQEPEVCDKMETTPSQPAKLGPRLARLARKGIKSREVIGLNLADFEFDGVPKTASFYKDHDEAPAQVSPAPSRTKSDIQTREENISSITRTRPTAERQPACKQGSYPIVDDIESPKARVVEPPPSELPLNGEAAIVKSSDRPAHVSRTDALVRNKAAQMANCQQDVHEDLIEKCVKGRRATENGRQLPVEGIKAIRPSLEAKQSPQDSTTSLIEPAAETLCHDAVCSKAPMSPAVKPKRQITNPATRGRKAALKSDAAGKAPQNVLPPPGLPAPMYIAKRPNSPVAEKPAKRKMRFPGFISATDVGPWSREAEDLLGMDRPHS
jgi:hypothetical protein